MDYVIIELVLSVIILLLLIYNSLYHGRRIDEFDSRLKELDDKQ